jgi:hypothetical protein
MTMSDLTIQQQAKLVSKDQLSTLRPGTRISVKWPNGEGPYQYTLAFDGNLPFAVDNWGDKSLISFVGFGAENDRVILG